MGMFVVFETIALPKIDERAAQDMENQTSLNYKMGH
jgi:hypothetical protein